MNTSPVLFSAVTSGAAFAYNGNVWVKRSTRTAYLPMYRRVFYFGMSDIVRLI